MVHLLDKYPDYLQFFKDSLKQGRTVLLDNSLFELEKQFNIESFASWIEALLPTEYIIPDKLDDMPATLMTAELWNKQFSHLPGKKIGVVQGRTKEELIQCYIELEPMVDKIAISFNCQPYLAMSEHPSKWVRFMLGRIEYLSTLRGKGIINKSKPHHLLGASHPMEFSFYGKEFHWIESLDTSSPIMLGYAEHTYNEFFIGDWEKPKTKMVEIFEKGISPTQLSIMQHNIIDFRRFVNAA
ncbi:MAG: hypothetical protein ACREAU_03005 [Nitrosopumilaceae archaeon]